MSARGRAVGVLVGLWLGLGVLGGPAAAQTTTDECATTAPLSVSEYAACQTAHDTDHMRAEVETGLFLLVFVGAAGLGLRAANR